MTQTNQPPANPERFSETGKAELHRIEAKIEGIVGRITETESPSLIAAYENQVKKLEEQRIMLTEQMAGAGAPSKTFEETFRTAMAFLANPRKLWAPSFWSTKGPC